jgi:hypothetical protein
MRNPVRMALSVLVFGVAAWSSPSVAQDVPPQEAAQPTSGTASEMAAWVAASHDNRDLPYVIVDKVAAEVFVFDPDGQPIGRAPALLGLAHGDESAPGVGDRDLAAISPDERTTPAGRFLAGFGPATGRQRVFWVDFATAISLHAVVTSDPKEQRLQRLRSPSPDDNRITYGCVNVPAAFYRDVVRKTFADTAGVVYILPETRPLAEVFPGFRTRVASAPADGLAEAP